MTTPPSPIADELTAPYWHGGATSTLVIQRCACCRQFRHPPQSRCFECASSEVGFEPVSGGGAIVSFTITHDARTPAFTARQPYAIVWVELDEQPHLIVIANMPGTPLSDVEVGRRVTVCFEQLNNDVWLPQFRLETANPRSVSTDDTDERRIE